MSEKELSLRLELLRDTDVWQWPAGADEAIASGLGAADITVKTLALESAASVIDDRLAGLALALLANQQEEQEVRVAAVEALGSALEECCFCEEEALSEEAPLSGAVITEIQRTLRRLYYDSATPDLVRQRLLVTAVRSPQPWHEGAIRACFASGDEHWQVAALECMALYTGFSSEVLTALRYSQPRLQIQAIHTAGALALTEAAPVIVALAHDEEVSMELRLAAIASLPKLGAPAAVEALEHLLRNPQPRLRKAAEEALVELEMWQELELYR